MIIVAIQVEDMNLEKEKLQVVMKKLLDTIEQLDDEISSKVDESIEFKKMVWKDKYSMDKVEQQQFMSSSLQEATLLIAKDKYFRKLLRMRNNPYFASIIFDTSSNHHEIYMGITYLKDDDIDNMIYDWRSPICSLFYDNELGECSYLAPEGQIFGSLKRKRQYKIENGNLVGVFDNSINISDDLLQEVLATKSDEKMKNIVNTIQKEQNEVIRDIDNQTLIVQGIAGSGKTSVALHRIAFLLYKIKNLTSSNILIFSPNQIFTEYIANVLPELGEDNTLQTTFHDYLSNHLKEYRKVESFMEFIEKYYTKRNHDFNLIKYKQSEEIILDIKNYIENIIHQFTFHQGIVESHIFSYTKEELFQLFKRYERFPLVERINQMAIKLSETNYNGTRKKVSTYRKLIMESCNFSKDYKQIYVDFYKSHFSKMSLPMVEEKNLLKSRTVFYEDALLMVYMKGLLEGFPYENQIKEVVVDEAQDYNKLQYIILKEIFKRANFTILGDVNQSINPYYHYDSLASLESVFEEKCKYIELNKTYRSSSEIIDYTNKILGLNHVSAIRKETNIPVIIDKIKNFIKDDWVRSVKELEKKYQSIAIITLDDATAKEVYDELNNDLNLTLIELKQERFAKNLVVLPAYIAKGLEFDCVIVYVSTQEFVLSKNLFYTACTRAQHQLMIKQKI